MLNKYVLLTLRSFQRYKSSFIINFIGLSSGLACGILIYMWVDHERSIDRFHEKDSRLFQVMQNVTAPDGVHTGGSTPGLLAQALEEEIPEVEYAVVVGPPRFTMGTLGIISTGNSDTRIKASELYVSSDYFNAFSYKLLHGNKDQVLDDKYAVVLSEELALKLFRTTENVVGKTIEWDRGTGNSGKVSGVYTVSGIFETLPSTSSAQFDLLFSYQLYLEKYASNLEDWGNSGPITYVVLKEGTDVSRFNAKISNFIKTKIKAADATRNLESVGSLFLQKYSDGYLYGQYENGVRSGGRIEYVNLFSIIAVFILAIACINFMNLSTARATRRLKEVGIKKALGASRTSLVVQYIGESMLMTLISLVIAALLVIILLPQFNEITGKQLTLEISGRLFAGIMTIVLLTGLVSGSYPAFYLSSFNPVSVLKGRISTSVSELLVRKGLVIFQFIVSVILIVSVWVVYSQIKFIQTRNLGYNKDNVIHFPKEGKVAQTPEPFLAEIKKIPGVVNAAIMGYDISTPSGTTSIDWEGKDPALQIDFGSLEVGYDLIEVLGYKIKEGRSFSKNFSTDHTKIIFNEAGIKAMGLKDPIGKTVQLWGEDRQIIGVVEDFHFESLYQKVKPCFLRIEPQGNHIVVKIAAGTQAETLSRLQDFYTRYNQGLHLDYRFLDEDYQVLYASENRIAVLSRYFAAMAVLISCLGLFGLASFTAERRRKEIGIRKVLGLNEFGIVRLLSLDFTKMVLIAITIALPVSYLIAKEWLDRFAYRIELQWWFFVGAGLATLFIAWVTVASQTLNATRINPLDTLRTE